MAFELELWMSRWPVVYVMAGITLLGILSKEISRLSLKSLSRAVGKLNRNPKRVRNHMVSQSISWYEQSVKEGKTPQVEEHLRKQLAFSKIGFIPVYRLENGNLVAMTATVLLGMVSTLLSYVDGCRMNETLFLFTAGFFCAGLCLLFEVFSGTEYYRGCFLLGMKDYFSSLPEKKEAEEPVRKETGAGERVIPSLDGDIVTRREREQLGLVKPLHKEQKEFASEKQEYSAAAKEAVPQPPKIDKELLEDLLKSMLME
ncbi:MAG: hypothetical protein SOT70_08265 [Lachnospiraceae bacterium]|nr:hypothetical protein [Lachnospiraceae bacterium]